MTAIIGRSTVSLVDPAEQVLTIQVNYVIKPKVKT